MKKKKGKDKPGLSITFGLYSGGRKIGLGLSRG